MAAAIAPGSYGAEFPTQYDPGQPNAPLTQAEFNQGYGHTWELYRNHSAAAERDAADWMVAIADDAASRHPDLYLEYVNPGGAEHQALVDHLGSLARSVFRAQ